jgi:hypothetical protein
MYTEQTLANLVSYVLQHWQSLARRTSMSRSTALRATKKKTAIEVELHARLDFAEQAYGTLSTENLRLRGEVERLTKLQRPEDSLDANTQPVVVATPKRGQKRPATESVAEEQVRATTPCFSPLQPTFVLAQRAFFSTTPWRNS